MDQPTADLEALVAKRLQSFEIVAAALFGSRATGHARADSDLDLAILPATSDSEARRRLQVQVAVELADLAPDGRVDVVLLDEAPETVRHNILAHGRLVLCRDRAAWKELRVRTMREHGDREPLRRLLRRAQKRRLQEGPTSGRSGRALESLERTRDLSR
jgi:predicted nucleotidyltransferase